MQQVGQPRYKQLTVPTAEATECLTKMLIFLYDKNPLRTLGKRKKKKEEGGSQAGTSIIAAITFFS